MELPHRWQARATEEKEAEEEQAASNPGTRPRQRQALVYPAHRVLRT